MQGTLPLISLPCKSRQQLYTPITVRMAPTNGRAGTCALRSINYDIHVNCMWHASNNNAMLRAVIVEQLVAFSVENVCLRWKGKAGPSPAQRQGLWA